MKKFLKKIIKIIFNNLATWISRSFIGVYLFNELAKNFLSQPKLITHNNIEFKFLAPNLLNLFRVSTFHSKEPDTLEWINSMKLNSILWDIGANIGLYSIYAAKTRKSRVYAFEPSVFNLELLARNIYLNSMQSTISIIPVALSYKMNFNMFKMTNTDWGGALSSFEHNINQDGQPVEEVFEYQTLGISLDGACDILNIPAPDYLKIDVDGIEHFILKGGMKLLQTVSSVMIEINDDFPQQSEESTIILKNAGLILNKKSYLGNQNLYNQWWTRSP
jgi:FkbM family methyltransferase